eukprot:291436_1
MSAQSNASPLSMSSLMIILAFSIIRPSESQTDVSSFGIFASSDFVSTNAIRLSLSWNKEQWECIINETMSPSTQYYMCTSGDFEPTASLINSSLASDTYEMKIELIDGTIDALFRISTIRVADDDVNYYDIDTFCLPLAFKHHSARNHTSNREKCCMWSQRYSYNNYAMGSKQNDALKTSYALFGSDVLSHPNKPQEGAIKPPMITEISLKTLDKEGAESLADYSFTLHWDTEEYLWSFQPNETNKTFTKTFSSSDAFCEFFSGFSLEITASSTDALGIDTIIITDESGYLYTIDMFCPSDQIETRQMYNDSGQQCDSEWSDYSMYHGFIYNGTSTLFVTADDLLFVNPDQKHHGLILQEDYAPVYSCTSNDVTIVTPRAFTLFKDNMDDPISTGWSFEGTYREQINAVNCPSGSADRCSRLAGHEGSTTIDSSMEITIDVSDYVGLMYVSIQYDVVLSTMSSGKSCYVYYALDGGSFVTANTYTSSGSTTLEKFHNQSFAIPDYSDLEYTNITIKFLNDALWNNEYCYVDNVYVLVGDMWLEGDYCESFNSSWTYSGATISTERCHDDQCIYLYGYGSWALKTFDIHSYNNLVLIADFKIQGTSGGTVNPRDCYLDYFYDDEPETALDSVSGLYWRSYPKQKFIIPDSQICGASSLSIRFSTDFYGCTVDNIVLLGNVLDTASPTGSPIPLPTRSLTKYPSINPTSVTTDPTSIPTTYPTKYPTINPTSSTMDPSSNPTIYPTEHP